MDEPRELSDQEKEFIKSITKKRGQETDPDSFLNKAREAELKYDSALAPESDSVPDDQDIDSRDLPGYKRISRWIAALLILPMALSAGFMVLIMRTEAYVGKDSMEWISKNGNTEAFSDAVSDAGMSWMTTMVSLYGYRWLIVGVLFAVCFSIAIVLALLDARKRSE